MTAFAAFFEKIRRFTAELLGLENGVFYINGPETLPPPLTKDEEEHAFSLLSTDKAKGREMLIIHNLRLVVYIARKFESTGICIDDLVSIGTIGLIKAVNTFSPEKNIKLATYASRCIENEILMFLRKSSQHRNDISIDEPLNIDWDGNELLLSDILGTDDDEVNSSIEDDPEIVLKVEEFKNTVNEKYFKKYGYTWDEKLADNDIEFTDIDEFGLEQGEH